MTSFLEVMQESVRLFEVLPQNWAILGGFALLIQLKKNLVMAF